MPRQLHAKYRTQSEGIKVEKRVEASQRNQKENQVSKQANINTILESFKKEKQLFNEKFEALKHKLAGVSSPMNHQVKNQRFIFSTFNPIHRATMERDD